MFMKSCLKTMWEAVPVCFSEEVTGKSSALIVVCNSHVLIRCEPGTWRGDVHKSLQRAGLLTAERNWSVQHRRMRTEI